MDWFVSRTLDGVFNQGAIDYFLTGNFEFSMPGMDKIVFNDPSVIKTLDFVGLNKLFIKKSFLPTIALLQM